MRAYFFKLKKKNYCEVNKTNIVILNEIYLPELGFKYTHGKGYCSKLLLRMRMNKN